MFLLPPRMFECKNNFRNKYFRNNLKEYNTQEHLFKYYNTPEKDGPYDNVFPKMRSHCVKHTLYSGLDFKTRSNFIEKNPVHNFACLFKLCVQAVLEINT